MKELLSVLAVFICTYSAAQVKIMTAVDTSLYVGVDNPVKIESATIPLSKLKLRSGNGEVSGKEGKYMIKCSKAGQAILLDVVHNNKIIATKIINVNRINDPVVYALGDSLFSSGDITKQQLLRLHTLITKINYPLVHWDIHGFTVEIIHAGKSKGSISIGQNKFTANLNLFLKTAETGDEIIFDSIQVAVGAGCKKAIPSLKFKVI